VSGRSGFYFSIVKEGEVEAGSAIEVLSRMKIRSRLRISTGCIWAWRLIRNCSSERYGAGAAEDCGVVGEAEVNGRRIAFAFPISPYFNLSSRALRERSPNLEPCGGLRRRSASKFCRRTCGRYPRRGTSTEDRIDRKTFVYFDSSGGAAEVCAE